MIDFTGFNHTYEIVFTGATIVLGLLAARNKVIISSLKESNSAYEELIKARDLQHSENQKRIITLEQKSKVLEDQVTQAPQINELILQLATQHKEIMQSFTSMTKELSNVATAITINTSKDQ